MNWEALGAVAEFLAVVAVLPTLIYLARQLHQNTRALKSATIDSLVGRLTASVEAVATSETISDLLVRAQTDYDLLSDGEKARHTYVLMMIVRRYEGVFFQRSLGFVEHEMTQGFERSVLSIITSNRSWWKRTNQIFSDSFVDYVNSRIETDQPAGILPGLGGEQGISE